MALLSRLAGIRLITGALGICLAFPALSQTRGEYQVKAAFLLNFARFVEWPQEALPNPTDPIATCVLGQDPFGRWLKDTVDGRSIEGRALILRRISKPDEAGTCQILFVSASEPKRTWSALTDTPMPGVLTIGETPEAGQGGAVIIFTLEDDRVRFEINTQAADRAKLRLNSRLLSLAKAVRK
jgi:hypothetical protein